MKGSYIMMVVVSLLNCYVECEGCLEEERSLLLQLKSSLNLSNEDSFHLSDWEGQYCCEWDEVSCSNTTSRVFGLLLDPVGQQGSLSADRIWYPKESVNILAQFKELQYLYMSGYRMNGSDILQAFCKLQYLKELTLYSTSLEGNLPPRMEICYCLSYRLVHKANLQETCHLCFSVHWREAAMPMTPNDENAAIKGKYTAMFLCWILGAGSLFPWNSMLTTLDYYIPIFPNYHPSRVLTIAVLSFAFGTIIIMTYYEVKMNTRRRNLIGYTLYFIGSVSVLVLNLTTSRSGGIGAYIGFPELLQSFLAGLAASGTITSAFRLAMKAAFENTKGGLRKGALLFLALSASFELVCVFLYAYVFFKVPIVKYYHSKAAAEGSKTVSIDLTDAGIQVQATPSVRIKR
ncbi:hypothetical protein AAC387_Pa03g2638 [Persea americana]